MSERPPNQIRKDSLTLGEAIGLLRLINDLADRKHWSMVSVHLQVWAEVLVDDAKAPPSRGGE